MDRRGFVVGICTLALPLGAKAQARLYRIGVVHQGGPYATATDGLRDGLKTLGLAESKQYVFHVRDVKSDLKVAEAAGRDLEAEKVDVVYSIGTSVTLALHRSTKSVPVVFYAGSDPVKQGLIANFRKPGGRFTGIHSQFVDLTAKRMQVLKALLPSVRRVITYYNPGNPVAQQAIKLAREGSRQLNVELSERTVSSVDELRAALAALKPGEANALFMIGDGMVISQADMVIAAANAKKLPVMTSDEGSVSKGALASYGVSYYTCGRLAAKYVVRILNGANPGELPIEQIDTPQLVINMRAAKSLGLTLPEAVLARADEVIR